MKHELRLASSYEGTGNDHSGRKALFYAKGYTEVSSIRPKAFRKRTVYKTSHQ